MTFSLCKIDEIEDPGARGFEIKINNKELNIFLVKKDSQVHGYINSCPHNGINLEWQPNDFLDIDKNMIQCSVHGALFQIETGACLGGPCNGQRLRKINLGIESNGSIIYIDGQSI